MNCDRFESILDRLCADALPPDELREAQAHRASCPRCRRLEAIAGGEAEALPAALGNALTDAILQRTSGAACRQAAPLLCDRTDGILDAGRGELLENHLLHCAGCRQLSETLQELRQLLPSMAELPAPPAIVPEVMRRTSAQQAVDPWWSRMRVRLGRWALQPQFTLEAAYLATLLLLALVGNPAAVVDRASPVLLASFQTQPERVWQAASGFVEESLAAGIRTGGVAIGWLGDSAGKAWRVARSTAQQTGEAFTRLWKSQRTFRDPGALMHRNTAGSPSSG